MVKLLERFERTISGILLVLALLMVVYQVVQLIWNSIESFSTRFREVGWPMRQNIPATSGSCFSISC
jgi:hypothetical protein